MTKKKSFVAYLSSLFLLIVCLVLTACGGPSDGKKDASQAGKNIEITDVSGQTVTLKNQPNVSLYNGVRPVGLS